MPVTKRKVSTDRDAYLISNSYETFSRSKYYLQFYLPFNRRNRIPSSVPPPITNRIKSGLEFYSRGPLSGFLCLACQPIEQLAKPTDLPSTRSLTRAYLSTCLPAWPHPTWPDPVACDFGFVILTSTILKDLFPGGVASWRSRCHARAVCITLHRRDTVM